jgi:hypothetical protein
MFHCRFPALLSHCHSAQKEAEIVCLVQMYPPGSVAMELCGKMEDSHLWGTVVSKSRGGFDRHPQVNANLRA